MYWYNLTTRHDEDIPTPPNDARAIEMLSGHPDSEEFIEEYRRRRKSHGIEKALIITGEALFRNHHLSIHKKSRGYTAQHPPRPLDRLSTPLREYYKRDGLRIL